MVFSSSTFLMLFLPLTLALYYVLGVWLTKSTGVKNFILLLASLVFYAWGEPVYIVLMLISILFNFIAGKDIAAAKRRGKARRAKSTFVMALVFNLAVLGFFKYFDFLVENFNLLFHTKLQIPALALPVGISFYTFQIMSYIVDLYRGKAGVQRRIVPFALYITLFPQLIAGPIVKYTDIADQLKNRQESVGKYMNGMTRFTVGLAKKLLLANTLGAVYTTVQEWGAANTDMLGAWLGIACYTLQIYFDFSGYSDMAIGLGGMFGFHINENFNYPYIATSVTDFWRRWHMSLSGWFKDYVYIPLGGNRCSKAKNIRNLLIVWLLTGLWHGASWNFVAWGLYYGLLLIMEKYLLQRLLRRLPDALTRLVTLVLVAIGWVFFSAADLPQAMQYIGVMFGSGARVSSDALYLLTSNLLPLLLGIFCATPLYKKVFAYMDARTVSKCKIIAFPLLFILCVIFMISETYNPFLYFRF